MRFMSTRPFGRNDTRLRLRSRALSTSVSVLWSAKSGNLREHTKQETTFFAKYFGLLLLRYNEFLKDGPVVEPANALKSRLRGD